MSDTFTWSFVHDRVEILTIKCEKNASHDSGYCSIPPSFRYLACFLKPIYFLISNKMNKSDSLRHFMIQNFTIVLQRYQLTIMTLKMMIKMVMTVIGRVIYVIIFN